MSSYSAALRLRASASEFLGLRPGNRSAVVLADAPVPELPALLLGSVVSDFGTWLQNTAQVLLAYHLAHSALAVGLVTCAQFTSPLVLGPWAGVLADRIGGRQTLLLTQVASAAIAAGSRRRSSVTC